MRRFERRVVGGSPAARSIFSAWPRSSGLRLLSGSTQVQILSRGLFGGETGRGAGTRLNRTGRPRVAGEHDLSPPPFFRRVKPRSAVIGWKPFRAVRPVGQDHCSPPFFLESESAEVRTLFRKQMDRPRRLRRKSSALCQFSARSLTAERPIDNRLDLVRFQAGGPLWRVNSESREPRC